MKIIKSNERYNVTIPKSLVTALKIEEGQQYNFVINSKGNLELIEESKG